MERTRIVVSGSPITAGSGRRGCVAYFVGQSEEDEPRMDEHDIKNLVKQNIHDRLREGVNAVIDQIPKR